MRGCLWACFFSSGGRHTRFDCDWSSDVCSSDLSSGMRSPSESAPGVFGLASRVSTTPSQSVSLLNSPPPTKQPVDRKSTRLNSSHSQISYAVFCLKKKKQNNDQPRTRDSHFT